MKKFFCCLYACMMLAAVAQTQPNALKHYTNGRDLQYRGRTEDAINEYNIAISICLDELETQPNNIDSYTVYTWSLLHLKKYDETVRVCRQALNINEDPRIIETMAEALFYLNKYDECLANMQKYIAMAPTGERVSTAYFFEGEVYRNRSQYNKAEIAYSAATHLEASMSIWWYRLGSVREATDNKEGAIEAYKRAVALSPNYTDAIKGLSRLGVR